MRDIWAPRALERTGEIAQYIAADRPEAARGWVRALFARVATLRDHPRRGRRVPEIGRDEIREVLHGEYRVVYRTEPKQVVVLTVRHGRRQWDPEELDER